VRVSAILTMLVSLGFAYVGPLAQFKVSTSLVRLEVSVTDDRGAVQKLRPEDFVVQDNGARQIVRVDEWTDAALDLVLVAEPLASVAYIAEDQLPRVREGLAAFLNEVQDRDRLAAFVAGGPPSRLRPLEFGRPTFDVDAFTGNRDAAPFDAIAAGLAELGESDRRRALIAFTNTADTRSTISFDALTGMLGRLGPGLVLVGTPVRAESGLRVFDVSGEHTSAAVSGYVFPARLQVLARKTGGIAVNLGSGNPATLVEDMFKWLRTSYVISYYPPSGKGWHPISVKVNRRGAKVTVRDGYYSD